MRQKNVPDNIYYDEDIERSSKSAITLHKSTKNLNTGWHLHTKAQLLYAENGMTRVHTIDGSFLLPTRHCAWIPAKLVHMVTSSSPDLFLRVTYFNIDSKRIKPFYDELSVFQVSDLLREMIIYTERWAETNYAEPEEVYFMEALRLILPDLKGTSLGLRLPASEHPKVNKIISYILDNLSKRISVEEAALKAAMSTRTVARLFHRELETSFTKFVKIARIIKALELLSLPDANVSETAYMVGYESVPSFSNSFFEIVGSRPQSFLTKMK